MRARNYDTVTGRFLAPDPLGPQDSASTYAYVANNPLGLVDPSGMKRMPRCSLLCQIGGVAYRCIQNSVCNIAAVTVIGVVTRGGARTGPPPTRIAIPPKIAREMPARGWNQEMFERTIATGRQIRAVNKANGNPATRYEDPVTGQSAVVDDLTGEFVQVGGPGFKFGPGSGDLP